MKGNSNIYLLVLLVSITILLVHCSKKTEEPDEKQEKGLPVKKKKPELNANIEFTSGKTAEYHIGDEINFRLQAKKDTFQIDSVHVLINDSLFRRLDSVPVNREFRWDSKNGKTGQNTVSSIFYSPQKEYTISETIILLSDISPTVLKYKIINTYPHDSKAYTQGLFFYNGYLYESTGLRGGSTLRKVELESGEIINNYTIRDNYFCEGITHYNDKIIQLTWQSNTGFVYDLESFELKQKFTYPTEGWGITTAVDKLVMSDGSANLYFLNIDTYVEEKRIQVYDNKKAIINLNELEYVDGYIYANIYGEERIAKIDIDSGKVISWIQLEKLLKMPELQQADIDVMNGIAFHPETGHFFITGKEWPLLFEIKLLD